MLAGFFIATSFALGYVLGVYAGFAAPEVLSWAQEHYLASGIVYFAGSASCSGLWYYTAASITKFSAKPSVGLYFRPSRYFSSRVLRMIIV